MIKLTSKLYIHILTPVMLAVCFLNHRMSIFLFTYAVMTVHEAAHMLAAVCIGLQVDKIVFYPYGVNLKLKNKFVHSMTDEMILYLSGPLVNCIFALISLFLYHIYRLPELQLFYAGNIMLFVSNMLPVYPLDGGIILKKLLSHFLGSRAASVVMSIISVIFIILLMALGIYTVYVTEFNFSIMLLTAFLFCSLFTQSEKYDVDFVRELMFYRNKSKGNIQHMIANEHDDYKSIARRFVPGKYGVVYMENDRGKITRILSEQEIMEQLTGAREMKDQPVLSNLHEIED